MSISNWVTHLHDYNQTVMYDLSSERKFEHSENYACKEPGFNFILQFQLSLSGQEL